MGTSVTFYRLNPEVLNKKYVYYALQSPVFVNQYEAIMEQTTRSQVPITAPAFLEIPVAPIKQQEEVVRSVDAAFARIDRMVAEAARAAALLERLEAQLLAKAFRGELVPQDPNDEPASALLARIRDARANAPKPKRRRKIKAN